MSIFYPEYAVLVIFIVITVCRILKDVPDGDRKRNPRTDRNDGMSDADQKSAKRKEKNFLS